MSERAGRTVCGATIEREWPGHHAVLSRRRCGAYPMKGYDHCRHHLTLEEQQRRNDESRADLLAKVAAIKARETAQ